MLAGGKAKVVAFVPAAQQKWEFTTRRLSPRGKERVAVLLFLAAQHMSRSCSGSANVKNPLWKLLNPCGASRPDPSSRCASSRQHWVLVPPASQIASRIFQAFSSIQNAHGTFPLQATPLRPAQACTLHRFHACRFVCRVEPRHRPPPSPPSPPLHGQPGSLIQGNRERPLIFSVSF